MRDAIVAVLRRGERFLWIQRAPETLRAGYWAPLSGRVEPGESQAACVVREVREEVGLVVRAEEKVWECPTDDGAFTLHWWTAAIVGGALVPDPREVSDARWLTVDEARNLTPTFEADFYFFESIAPQLGS